MPSGVFGAFKMFIKIPNLSSTQEKNEFHLKWKERKKDRNILLSNNSATKLTF